MNKRTPKTTFASIGVTFAVLGETVYANTSKKELDKIHEKIEDLVAESDLPDLIQAEVEKIDGLTIPEGEELYYHPMVLNTRGLEVKAYGSKPKDEEPEVVETVDDDDDDDEEIDWDAVESTIRKANAKKLVALSDEYADYIEDAPDYGSIKKLADKRQALLDAMGFGADDEEE
jgi:hypothetical protein